MMSSQKQGFSAYLKKKSFQLTSFDKGVRYFGIEMEFL